MAAADRQRWSEVSDRKSVLDLLNMEVRPRFLLERMIWSKSMRDRSLAGLSSRSWTNSLNAIRYQQCSFKCVTEDFTLSLLQYSHVICIFMRQASQEPVHVKPEKHPGLFLIASRRFEEFSICVEETCETANECCSHLFRVKCC